MGKMRKFSTGKYVLLSSIIVVAFLTAFSANAQDAPDSLQQRAVFALKEKFPRTRVLNFEYGESTERDFDSKLFDEDFNAGTIARQRYFNATANIPLYTDMRLRITGSLNYQYNGFEFQNVNSINPSFNNISLFETNGTREFHYLSAALSGTYFAQLFNKPIIYNATILVDGSDEGVERLKGLMGFAFVLKKTVRTTITLGALIVLDPTAQIPFAPTFSWNHKFKNSKWEFDFILPQRLLFRRSVGDNGRLSLGSTFGITGFYVGVDEPDFPDTFEYSQLEIKSGLMYEYKITDYIIGTLQGGIQNNVSNLLTERAEPINDNIYENEQDMSGYFQVGFSIDPFFKKKD